MHVTTEAVQMLGGNGYMKEYHVERMMMSSGFGQYGPLTHRACYDIVAQAMGGMVNLTGFKDTDPVKVGPSVADHVSGIYLTVGVLAALHHRDMTGEGQQVDVSMFDTIFSLLEKCLSELYNGRGDIAEKWKHRPIHCSI